MKRVFLSFFLLLIFSGFIQRIRPVTSPLNKQWIVFSRAGSPIAPNQCYSYPNVFPQNGYLVALTLLKTTSCESFDLAPASYSYSSGFFAMKSFNYLYGTLEFSAKFGPCRNLTCNSSGSWPALWMADVSCQASDPTGTNDDCNNQEIDVTEFLSAGFDTVNQQIHVDQFVHNDGCTPALTNASTNFHVYQLVWAAGSLIWKIDGTTTCTITQSYVPNAAMYVKLNMAVGAFGGTVNNATLPWYTLIDYIKVTQGSTIVFEDTFD